MFGKELGILIKKCVLSCKRVGTSDSNIYDPQCNISLHCLFK